MGVLHSFVWDHVKFANMEGFCRDSHIYVMHMCSVIVNT